VPDLREFPRRQWNRAVKQVLKSATANDLGYGDVKGPERLRTRLAEYLRRVRAVDAVPAHMVICSGVTQAIGVAVRALVASGIRRVAVEDPSHPDLRRLIVAAGAQVVCVRVDGDGLLVRRLAQSRAWAVIVTPAHQFPSGAVLSSQRRLESCPRVRTVWFAKTSQGLHLLGLDHTKLTFRFNGRDMRLTDVYGVMVPQIAGC